MRFRLGFVAGFAAGYYLGTMAGRERYEQINRLVSRAKRTDAYEAAAEKTKAAVDLGVERARDAIEDKLPGGNGAADQDNPYPTPRAPGQPN